MLFKKLLVTGKERISLVYINNSNNPHKSSASYTNIKIKKTQIKAIVDSGAEVTLINQSLAKRLNLQITKSDDTIRYIAANNQVLPHTGFTLLDIEIGQWKTKQKAIVVKDLSADILLGTDWLKQHGVILNYHKAVITCGKFTSKLLTTRLQTTHGIFTNKAISIAPLTSHVEWVTVPEIFNGTSYFENENPIRYLEVRDGLFEIQQNSMPIVLVNKNKFEIKLGKFLGNLETFHKY